MKKHRLPPILLFLLLLGFIYPADTLAKSKDQEYAYIRVPVANVWLKPALRKIDEPSAATDANVPQSG